MINKPLAAVLSAAAIVAAGYVYLTRTSSARVPVGLAKANGRIEVQRVDVATKLAGRLAGITVKEGDFVNQGTVVARMDDADLRAQLASAKASPASLGRP